MDVWRLGQAGGALPNTFSFPAPAGPPDGGPLLFLRAWAFGDGAGDGFVGGVSLGRQVDGGVAGERLGAGDFGDFVGAEGVGGLAGFGFFPGAEEEFAGLGIGAEAVGVDEALGGSVLDEEGRAGADERGKGLGRGVNRLGLRGGVQAFEPVEEVGGGDRRGLRVRRRGVGGECAVEAVSEEDGEQEEAQDLGEEEGDCVEGRRPIAVTIEEVGRALYRTGEEAKPAAMIWAEQADEVMQAEAGENEGNPEEQDILERCAQAKSPRNNGAEGKTGEDDENREA